MIDPIEIADTLAEFGEPLTLRRMTGSQRIPFDVELLGVVRQYRPEELVGGIVQGDCEIRISDQEIQARSWPGPPRKGDDVIRGDRALAVLSVETRKIGDAVAMHILQCRGKQ